MASANFNTEILSSNSSEFRRYNLNDVIDTDLNPIQSYRYGFNTEVPGEVKIEFDTLIIPPNLEFELSIVVSDGDKNNPTTAIATTNVIIDTKLNFSELINSKLSNNESLLEKYTTVKNNWSKIISERISSGDLIDGSVRPK